MPPFLFSCYGNSATLRKDVVAVRLSLPINTKTEGGSCKNEHGKDFILLDAGAESLPAENLEFASLAEVDERTYTAIWTFKCSRYAKADWLPLQVYLITDSGPKWNHKAFVIFSVSDIMYALVASEDRAIYYWEKKKEQHKKNIAALEKLIKTKLQTN